MEMKKEFHIPALKMLALCTSFALIGASFKWGFLMYFGLVLNLVANLAMHDIEPNNAEND